jgi:hypothetical protein
LDSGAGYAGTRRFYSRLGFVPVRQLSLRNWSEEALAMVKHIG